ncbi:uroporphyrinogen-III decarboxylase [Metasolibacillus meyeri]|uniref:Uroporphyrinogen-III decarboxylase n=1 Tax=Metasolibacillus meyeri TaxID=1071052 RepID=A0AAW9NQS7_9BACL|nr:uroporphyrinogen-III decarboxylase [Metasolibacillus meyeri]MEC1177198.1 uroporphyrinogen-III decarboxylase [Metasolibacillus meyeri]
MIDLVKTKFANLEPEQLSEIKNLEEKLDVTLIAYDLSEIEGQTQQGYNSDVINPL